MAENGVIDALVTHGRGLDTSAGSNTFDEVTIKANGLQIMFCSNYKCHVNYELLVTILKDFYLTAIDTGIFHLIKPCKYVSCLLLVKRLVNILNLINKSIKAITIFNQDEY